MAMSDDIAALQAALLQAQNASGQGYATKNNPTLAGELKHTGTKFGVNGKTPVVKAAAIAAPTAPSATYVQAEQTSQVTAINAIRVALSNVGIIT